MRSYSKRLDEIEKKLDAVLDRLGPKVTYTYNNHTGTTGTAVTTVSINNEWYKRYGTRKGPNRRWWLW